MSSHFRSVKVARERQSKRLRRGCRGHVQGCAWVGRLATKSIMITFTLHILPAWGRFVSASLSSASASKWHLRRRSAQRRRPARQIGWEGGRVGAGGKHAGKQHWADQVVWCGWMWWCMWCWCRCPGLVVSLGLSPLFGECEKCSRQCTKKKHKTQKTKDGRRLSAHSNIAGNNAYAHF